MPIFPARISDRRRPAGVTMMEMLLVVGLLALLLLLVAPSFQNVLQTSLERETGRLAGVIRLLRNEAVLKNTTFRVMMDLLQAGYSIEEASPQGGFVKRSAPSELRPHRLPDALEVKELVVLGEVIRPERGLKPVPILIDSSGYIDPFLLHFSYRGDEYTFRVAGFSGRVELVEGYVNP